MNRKLKIFLITIASIIVIYVIYITIDCIRLSNSNFDTRPLICIREQKIDYENKSTTRYTGIGYTIDYSYTKVSDIDLGKSMELKLFGNLILAWIE